MNAKKWIKETFSPLLLLATSLFFSGTCAAWSEPGQDFSKALTVDGDVTNVRNPWVWRVGASCTDIPVRATTGQMRQGHRAWSGLMPALPLLLGKTVLTSPTGREGLAPDVHFGAGQPDFRATPQGEGVIQIILPVYTPGAPEKTVGSLLFRAETAALIRYMAGGSPVYAGIYSELSGNGLSDRRGAMAARRTAQVLCGMFAGEGPGWVCDPSLNVSDSLALSRFTDGSLHEVDGVYGARIVAGSGELQINARHIPSSWRATLSVRVEYR